MRDVREPVPRDVLAARRVVSDHLAPTPVIPSPGLGTNVFLKLECLQPTGSFKVRGALCALTAAARRPGVHVVTASAGNHGLGVAYAAKSLGVRTAVVIPDNASPAKRAALERFAPTVELVTHGASYDDAEKLALGLAADGAYFVSAYNDPYVIAGQGTMALELFEQIDELDTIIAPVGGGGLVSGIALAAALRDRTHVWGVEATASKAVSAAVENRGVVEVEQGPTIADGLAGNIEGGSVTVPIVHRHVERLLDEDDDSMRDAVRFLAAEHGLVVEPSGAIGVASLLRGTASTGDVRERRIAVIISGRNVSPALFCDIVAGEG